MLRFVAGCVMPLPKGIKFHTMTNLPPMRLPSTTVISWEPAWVARPPTWFSCCDFRDDVLLSTTALLFQQLHSLQRKSHLWVPRRELRGLSPNSYIHVSVSDLYIPRICPHIWLQQNRQTDPGNI
jgi:hypothetical protein